MGGSWPVGPEPQDRFLDDEHELPVPLEQVALPADPLGDSRGDVVDFHAALLADPGHDRGHVRGGQPQFAELAAKALPGSLDAELAARSGCSPGSPAA